MTITDDDAAPAAPGPSDPQPPGSLPVMADKTAPKLTVAAKKVQRALKAKRFALKARCNERCKLAVVAKLRIGKRNVTLGRVKVTGRSGKTAKIKVKLSRKALGQAAQGDEARKGQGRPLRARHRRRRQPGRRVPQGRRQALAALSRRRSARA